MHAPAATLEKQCPACGATFTLADRRKRVQCPKCLAIVEIGPTKSATARTISLPPVDLEDLKARLSRVEALEERVAALEQLVAELRRGAAAGPPAQAGAKWRWLRHEPETASSLVGEISTTQRQVLIENLAMLGRRRIVIQALPGDLIAARLGNRLTELFEQAGWAVEVPVDPAPHTYSDPLALIANLCPPPQEMAQLFMALTAAGFKMVSQIDPNLVSEDPILLVGQQV